MSSPNRNKFEPELSPLEHNARALLLGLAYDMYTSTYRPRSPEGSKYKYTGCLDAGSMEPMLKGQVLFKELNFRRYGDDYAPTTINNTVSRIRMGLGDGSK